MSPESAQVHLDRFDRIHRREQLARTDRARAGWSIIADVAWFGVLAVLAEYPATLERLVQEHGLDDLTCWVVERGQA